MKSSTMAAIAVAIIVLIAGVVLLGGDDDTTDTQTNETTVQTTEPESSETAETNEESVVPMMSAEEVAMHASEDDCWTIVDGMVYDITQYIPRHPGGDEILLACGTDGTTLFTQRQTENGDAVGSGTPHSSMATSQLDSFRIGQLAN